METKPGFKTTEFWLTAAATVLAFFLASGVMPESSPVVKMLAFAYAALSSMGYAYGRSLVKASAVKPPVE